MSIEATIHLGKDDEDGQDMVFNSEPLVGDIIYADDRGLDGWKLTEREWTTVAFEDGSSERYLHITAEPVAVSDRVYAPRP